jgi:ATP-dependent DNA ligase
MNILERLSRLRQMFVDLEQNQSRNDKELIVDAYRKLDDQLSNDIDYAFEILAGKRKLGYTLEVPYRGQAESLYSDCEQSLEEFTRPLYEVPDRRASTIEKVCARYAGLGEYLNALFNRDWRLGIGSSQLPVTDKNPMLAKKYNPDKLPGKPHEQKFEEYFLTEKLDGNRCISLFNFLTREWEFWSRSGKRMKASFDMTGSCMPKDYIYDGEVLSRDQIDNPSQENFNSLSGSINSKYGDKSGLVYMIFDIMNTNMCYSQRRAILDSIQCPPYSEEINVAILPVLAKCNISNLNETVKDKLKQIEDRGGEGVMINLGSRRYEHKRTDSLLKVKSAHTMDMRVLEILDGTGKNEGIVGSLRCEAYDDETGTLYTCLVGSGLSDYEREYWANHPEFIVGKIVEVAYFSASQSKNTRGTPEYSLRFPRFKRIREDKNGTSIY